jgi:formylglycine-generating enzyme required for sulfatase activity
MGMIWMAESGANRIAEEEYDVVQVDKSGKVVNSEKHRCQTYVEKLTDGINLEMVLIPAGMFGMGTPGLSEFTEEHPHHMARVPSFLMSKYPVTQEQWKVVMGWEPPYRSKGPKHPADRISWKNAIEFCKRLSKKTGYDYRLPSEAEWEYTCRAGTSTPFHYGDTLTTDLANYVGDHTYQSGPKGVYRHGSTDVGSFPPNAFGLYDMHGNVWEWCADNWHDNYVGAPTNGSAWENGNKSTDRVMRGGSWHEPPINCRSATRLKMNENESDDFFGFRVALTSLERQTVYRSQNWLVEGLRKMFGK